MNRALWIVALAASLCGCSASLQTRLKEAQPPSALVLPDKDLAEKDRIALFEAHRGYLNSLGVQIGRRHFDRSLLPDYFRRSNLELFARMAESAAWNEKAKKKAAQLNGSFKWADPSRAGGSWEAAVVMLGVELVGLAVYQGWRVAAMQQLEELKRKAGPFPGTMIGMMTDYNRWLAQALGVKPHPSVIDPIQEKLPPLPKRPSTGLNASREDWLESYRFGAFGGKYYLGYQANNLKDVLPAYQIHDGEDLFKGSRRGKVGGVIFQIIGGVALATGSVMFAFKDSPNGFDFSDNSRGLKKKEPVPDSVWAIPLAGGALLSGLGITLSWRALKSRDQAVESINAKIAAKVFPGLEAAKP